MNEEQGVPSISSILDPIAEPNTTKQSDVVKTGEIILSPAAFSQALKTMQDVDTEFKRKNNKSNKNKK